MKKYSLTDLILKPNRDRPKYSRTKWRFYPTEASCKSPKGKTVGKCLRACAYQWLGYDETNPVNDFVKECGAIGIYLEDRTIREFKEKGIFPEAMNERSVRKQQIKIIDDESVLSGEVDIYIAGGTQEAGVEVKSYYNGTAKVEVGPKDPHMLQAFLYLCLFEPKQPYFLVYYRPNPSSPYATQGKEGEIVHRIDSVEIDGEVHPVINGKVDKRVSLNGIIERYAELKKHVIAGVLPKREFPRSSKNCEQCNFSDRCWNVDKEGKEL
jgi:hypothetical protein